MLIYSDIIANAVQGNGGNIQITTSGIFGLVNRPQLTESSDISASSQLGLSGTINISILNVQEQNVVESPDSNFVLTAKVNSAAAIASALRSNIAPLHPLLCHPMNYSIN